MTIQKAIESAIKSGYEFKATPGDDVLVLYGQGVITDGDLLIDPSFWQCLGKSEGWGKKVVVRRGTVIGNFCTPCSKEHPRGECFQEMGFGMDYLEPWAYHWHRLIDHLAEGGSIEDYFRELN